MTIAEKEVDEVRSLSREGLSQREIARRVRMSRGSVNAILTGKRVIKKPKAEGFRPPSGDIVRCLICGAKSPAPCMACAIREDRTESILPPENGPLPLRYELSTEQERTMRELRKAGRKRGNMKS
jgi:transcriptional regulator with XRE-family HTH domain